MHGSGGSRTAVARRECGGVEAVMTGKARGRVPGEPVPVRARFRTDDEAGRAGWARFKRLSCKTSCALRYFRPRIPRNRPELRLCVRSARPGEVAKGFRVFRERCQQRARTVELAASAPLGEVIGKLRGSGREAARNHPEACMPERKKQFPGASGPFVFPAYAGALDFPVVTTMLSEGGQHIAGKGAGDPEKGAGSGGRPLRHARLRRDEHQRHKRQVRPDQRSRLLPLHEQGGRRPRRRQGPLRRLGPPAVQVHGTRRVPPGEPGRAQLRRRGQSRRRPGGPRRGPSVGRARHDRRPAPRPLRGLDLLRHPAARPRPPARHAQLGRESGPDRSRTGPGLLRRLRPHRPARRARGRGLRQGARGRGGGAARSSASACTSGGASSFPRCTCGGATPASWSAPRAPPSSPTTPSRSAPERSPGAVPDDSAPPPYRPLRADPVPPYPGPPSGPPRTPVPVPGPVRAPPFSLSPPSPPGPRRRA